MCVGGRGGAFPRLVGGRIVSGGLQLSPRLAEKVDLGITNEIPVWWISPALLGSRSNRAMPSPALNRAQNSLFNPSEEMERSRGDTMCFGYSLFLMVVPAALDRFLP